MRGSLRSAVVTAATAAAVAVPFAGIASADVSAPQPSAAYAGGAVVSNGETAVVRVAYTCTSVVPMNHLFVAVKQGPNVSPDNRSSEAGGVTTFLSTNWSSDSGPNALTCDGKRHLQKIVLEPQPDFVGEALAQGPVLVQICVYDNVTGFDGYEPVGGFAASYTMQHAVITHAPIG